MPPFVLELFRRDFDPSVPSDAFSDQWKNPGDVFSVLLILGGDVVGRALAQLAGSAVTPVAFSFGVSSLHSANALRRVTHILHPLTIRSLVV